MQCQRDSDGRELDRHTLQVLRQKAVKAVANGHTVQSVADTLGVNIRSVFRWLSDYAGGGQNALLVNLRRAPSPSLALKNCVGLRRRYATTRRNS